MCTVPWMYGLTALQGINQYNTQKQQYNAQAAMYNAQAQTAENNARISQRKQEQIAEQYANQQRKLNDRVRLAAGQAAAQAGASGLQLSGSPLDSLSASYSAWNDDSNTLLSNQRNDVWSERMNEINYQNQANAYRASAANMQSQKKNALFGTILGTAASMYGIRQAYGSASAGPGNDLPKLSTNVEGFVPAGSQQWNFGTGKNGWTTSLQSGLFSSDQAGRQYQTGKQYQIKSPWSKRW